MQLLSVWMQHSSTVRPISQQFQRVNIVSNHYEQRNVFTRSRAPLCGFISRPFDPPNHLKKLFDLYTGAASSHKSPVEALHVCGILSFKHCVDRYQVPCVLSAFLSTGRRTVEVDIALTMCCQGLRWGVDVFTPRVIAAPHFSRCD